MIVATMHKIKRKIRINKNKIKWKDNYIFKLSPSFKLYSELIKSDLESKGE